MTVEALYKSLTVEKSTVAEGFPLFILETEDFSLCQIQVISFPSSQASSNPATNSG